jgi:hypothetical protein
MVCAMKLFTGTSAFEKSIQTRLVKHNFEPKEYSTKPRTGLGQNAIDSGTELLEYNYSINLLALMLLFLQSNCFKSKY